MWARPRLILRRQGSIFDRIERTMGASLGRFPGWYLRHHADATKNQDLLAAVSLEISFATDNLVFNQMIAFP